MAKITPIHGEMSGSIAGNTWSHNKGGQYVRQRTIPVNPSSLKQSAARNILGIISSGWFGLTDAQRANWAAWAVANPIVDTLGQSVLLSGSQAYTGINTRLSQAAAAIMDDPPVGTGPTDLTDASATLTAPGTIAVTFTPTPLPAGSMLVVWSTLPALVSRNPNRNQARLIGISSAAAASPQTLTSPYGATAGQRSNLWVCVMNAEGLCSPGLRITADWA